MKNRCHTISERSVILVLRNDNAACRRFHSTSVSAVFTRQLYLLSAENFLCWNSGLPQWYNNATHECKNGMTVDRVVTLPQTPPHTSTKPPEQIIRRPPRKPKPPASGKSLLNWCPVFTLKCHYGEGNSLVDHCNRRSSIYKVTHLRNAKCTFSKLRS